MNELKLYSDPKLVLEAGYNMGYNIRISTRANKKYMVLRPDGKWIHFGQIGYQDFTKHGDEKRRDSFWRRNWRWASADRYSPAYLSFHLLW